MENFSSNHAEIYDNGNGGLMTNGRLIDGASIDYVTGDIVIPTEPFKQPIHTANYSEFSLTDTSPRYVAVAGSTTIQRTVVVAPKHAMVEFVSSEETRTVGDTVRSASQTFDVLQGVAIPRIALLNSWTFEIQGKFTIERDGVLYQDWNYNQGTGTVVGSLNAATGIVTINNLAPNASPNIKVLSGVYHQGEYGVQQIHGRTAIAPVNPESFIAYAETGETTLRGDSQADGSITGTLSGSIDYDTGLFNVSANAIVPPESLRYNAVSLTSIPIDTDIGINAVRLPQDGRVPIFRVGDVVVLTNKMLQDLGSAHTAGATIPLNRSDADRVCVVDANGKHVLATQYDIVSGSLVWATPLDLSGYAMPLSACLIYEEENRLMGVNISGSLKLQYGLKRNYPIEKTYLSSAIIGGEKGDLLVRATEPFSQQAWTKVWQNTRIGDEILAKLNVKDYPIKLTSDGAINGRWLIEFVSPTQFKLYEERLGLIAASDTLSDLSPLNPATNKPFFTLPHLAFGGGWETRNCVRFNTSTTSMGIWFIRAIQPSADKTSHADKFTACLRGNTNIIE